MTDQPPTNDAISVMSAMGPVLPAMIRECIEHGFFNYASSRRLDPDAHTEYSDSCRAGMMYDRMAAVARDLVDRASGDMPSLGWRLSDNKRSTEVLFDPWFVIRIKRGKLNRGGLSSNVETGRQRTIKSPSIDVRGQTAFRYPGLTAIPREEDRLWLTASFDLDDVEECVTRASIGVELRRRLLWREPLPIAEMDIIARLSTPLADRIYELREIRLA